MERSGSRGWIGSYAANGGAGLYPLTVTDAGEWRTEPAEDSIRNASHGVRSARHGLVYLVDEVAGTLGAWRFDGAWSCAARVEAGGDGPCFVALDPAEARLAVAHYGSGSAALFDLDPATGLPAPAPARWQAHGHGTDPERQEGPHAHCVVFAPDGSWLYVVDLGTDRIVAFDPGRSFAEPRLAFAAPAGSGPRHLILHPTRPLACLVSELASTITLLAVDGPVLRPLDRCSTLPAGFAGESLGGHIGFAAAGTRVYVTNRGHDSIALFAVADERLALLGHVPSGGASPRFFHLDEGRREMLVAHEEGGGVTRFAVGDDGRLSRRPGALGVPGAVFILGAG